MAGAFGDGAEPARLEGGPVAHYPRYMCDVRIRSPGWVGFPGCPRHWHLGSWFCPPKELGALGGLGEAGEVLERQSRAAMSAGHDAVIVGMGGP